MRQISVSELAELSGKTRRTINKRISHLVPVSQKGHTKFFNSELALSSILKVELEQEFKSNIKKTEELPNYDESVDKNRLQRAKADMEELKYKEKMGELVEVSEIQAAVEKEYTLVRTTLLSIPTKKAKALSVIDSPAEIQTELEESINEALAHLEKDSNG